MGSEQLEQPPAELARLSFDLFGVSLSDEALGAGIDHIVVVSSRSKPAIDAFLA